MTSADTALDASSSSYFFTSRSRRIFIPVFLMFIMVCVSSLLNGSQKSNTLGQKNFLDSKWWNSSSMIALSTSSDTELMSDFPHPPPSPPRAGLFGKVSPVKTHNMPHQAEVEVTSVDVKTPLEHLSDWTINNKKNILSKYEATLAASLKCLKMGRKGDTMYYYSTELSACVPYPNGFAARPPTAYVPPSDPTLTTVMATVDDDGSGPAGIFSSHSKGKTPSLSNTVVEKYSPSIHSRWFFEAWRLWEGELGCSTMSDTAHDENVGTAAHHHQEAGAQNATTAAPQEEPFEMSKYMTTLKKSEFITNGEHNSSLPSTMYDLRNFCVDELQGTLLGFEEHISINNKHGAFESDHRMELRDIKPITEHVQNHRFVTTDRFLHSSNRETIRLVIPTENDAKRSWKDVIKTSIEAHHNTHNENSSVNTPAPEILFVEDQTIIIPTTAFEINNPGHQFHRLGSNLAMARLINARSSLVLTDIIAQDPRDRLYTSRAHLRGDREGLDAELLPKYLLTKDEVEAVLFHANGTFEPAFGNVGHLRDRAKERPASPAVGVRLESMSGWGDRPAGREGFHPVIHDLAASEAQANLARFMPYEAEFSPMLSSGEEDCEEVRCSAVTEANFNAFCSQEMKENRKRCGRPYALINVALPMTQEVEGRRQYRPDTQNYSMAVWGLAVRETMREAKRIRKDLWFATRNLKSSTREVFLPINGTPITNATPLAQRYRYMGAWRDRLIDLFALPSASNISMAESKPNTQSIYEDYFHEFFISRLEVNHFLEADVTLPKPRRQFICYQRAAVAHVFHDHVERHNPPGAIGLSTNADCNLEVTFRSIYESVWARYGKCMKNEKEDKIAHNSKKGDKTKRKSVASDTNRDAHPVFLLKGQSQQKLQVAFTESQTKINKLLQDLSVRPDLLALISRNSTESVPRMAKLVAAIASIQRNYDEIFMSYLAWGRGRGIKGHQVKDPTTSRPVRIFIAYRSSGSRSLIHWRNYLTALMNDDLGKYVELEIGEGLAGGAFSPTDPLYSAGDPMNTARARQYHTYLSTDLFIGPHGADMHSSAYVKPSALTTELASDFYDNTNVDHFRGGYFAAFAYARHVGFLKVMTHRKHVDDHLKGSWEKNHQSYLTLPDLRHTISVSLCSWLSMNAVRLADEERNLNSQSNTTLLTDFSYLVPWWCRGGAKAIARAAVDNLRERHNILRDNTELPSGNEGQLGKVLWFLQQKQLSEQAQYYHPRLAPTGFGALVSPVCPPLRAGIEWKSELEPTTTTAAVAFEAPVAPTPFSPPVPLSPPIQQNPDGSPILPPPQGLLPLTSAPTDSRRLSLLSTKISQNELNRLQSECARAVSEGHFETNYLTIRRRFVEGLQSLLETTLFMGERKAQLTARLMIEGVLAVEGENNEEGFYKVLTAIPITDIGQVCGLFPLDTDSHEERDGCLRAMLEILIDCECNSSRTENNRREFKVSEYFSKSLFASDILPSTIIIRDEALRIEVISYIVQQIYFAAQPSVRDAAPALMAANDFGYGWKC